MTKKERNKLFTQMVKDVRRMMEGSSSITIYMHGVKKANLPPAFEYQSSDNSARRQYVPRFPYLDITAFVRDEDRDA